jgi:hypothetical protein
MKTLIQETAVTVLTTVPPIVLFMGGVASVLCFAGLRLLEMLQAA